MRCEVGVVVMSGLNTFISNSSIKLHFRLKYINKI